MNSVKYMQDILIFKSLNPFLLFGNVELQIQAPKTAAYYISPIEIGVLWAKITHVKSHWKALGFSLQTDMN